MSTRRILFLVFGSLGALLALVLLAGGGVALWADTKRDDDGFFTSSSERFETTSFAFASEDLDVASDAPGWLLGSGRFGDIRLTGSSSDPAQAIFLGIGPEEDVAAYLADVERDVVTDVNFDPFEPTYRREAGAATPTAPGDETFWDASVQGSGSQTLEWEVEKGNWTVVVMNADASRDVNADLEVGANIGFVRGLGIGLLVAGALLLAGAATMIFFGARSGPRGPPVAGVVGGPTADDEGGGSPGEQAPEAPTDVNGGATEARE